MGTHQSNYLIFKTAPSKGPVQLYAFTKDGTALELYFTSMGIRDAKFASNGPCLESPWIPGIPSYD